MRAGDLCDLLPEALRNAYLKDYAEPYLKDPKNTKNAKYLAHIALMAFVIASPLLHDALVLAVKDALGRASMQTLRKCVPELVVTAMGTAFGASPPPSPAPLPSSSPPVPCPRPRPLPRPCPRPRPLNGPRPCPRALPRPLTRPRPRRLPRPSPSLSPPPRLSPSPVPSRSLASSPPLSHHHPPYRAGLRVGPFMYLSSAELEKLRSEASRPSSSSPQLLPHSPESLPLPPPVLSSLPHSVSSPAHSLLVLRQGPSGHCVQQHPTHSSVEDTTAAHLLSMAALSATTASVAAPALVPSEDTHGEGGAAQCEATSRLNQVCYVRALSTVLTLTPSSRAPHARLHPLPVLALTPLPRLTPSSPSPHARLHPVPVLSLTPSSPHPRLFCAGGELRCSRRHERSGSACIGCGGGKLSAEAAFVDASSPAGRHAGLFIPPQLHVRACCKSLSLSLKPPLALHRPPKHALPLAPMYPLLQPM